MSTMIKGLTQFPDTLMPTDATHPYYIVVPPYVRTSAGISALHVLCHWLNLSGFNAFLFLIPHADGLGVNPLLQTPILDVDIATFHFEAGLTPVVVYPEVLPGNPFEATVRARWVANYPGLLGGTNVFDDDEICFAHSEHLARAVGAQANILSIPVVDTKIFKPPLGGPRSGVCFYARKFQNVHGQSVFGLPPGAVEITRSTPATRAELAALFQKSELFYCFEDSSLMNEAALCGCPVIMMKNDYFKWPLGIDEVGWDGYAWGDEHSEVERAKTTVSRAYGNYIRNIPQFFSQLHTFVLLTQFRARITPYRRQVSLPGDGALVDEGRKLRQALADALLRLSSVEAAPGEGSILWTPELTRAGAKSAVTFMSRFVKIDAEGLVAGDSCAFTVCPGDAVTLHLKLALDAAASFQKDYNLVHDLDVYQRLTLTPGRDLQVSLPILEAGRPVFVTITAVDRSRPGTLFLKTIQTSSREDMSSEAKTEIPTLFESAKSTALQFALNEGAAKNIRAFNCAIKYRGADMIVDAFAPDPHIIVDFAHVNVDRSAMPVFFWGAYDIGRDETLQVYMPVSPSGTFSESVSCRVALKRGRHMFVTRLPRADVVGPIRIDPLDLVGRVTFLHLQFVFFRAAEQRPVVQPKAPLMARLDRFENQSLIDGTAFPIADKCIVGYERAAFAIRTNDRESSVLFYLAKPIYCVEDRPVSIYLACRSTMPGRLMIRFPETDGSYAFDGTSKEVILMRGYQKLEIQVFLSGPMQSLQFTFYESEKIEFFNLELAVVSTDS